MLAHNILCVCVFVVHPLSPDSGGACVVSRGRYVCVCVSEAVNNEADPYRTALQQHTQVTQIALANS